MRNAHMNVGTRIRTGSSRGMAAQGLLFLLTVVTFGALGLAVGPRTPAPQEQTITIRARQYGYEPGIIRVNRGDRVRLSFLSDDVVHGFYLEGYDLDATILPREAGVELRRPSQPNKVETVSEVVFTADRSGKFRYRCSHTCGFLHPFMLGELIVAPNRLLPVSVGLLLGIMSGGLVVVAVKERRGRRE